MPLARIRTQFPGEVAELSAVLVDAGYTVEVIRPESFRISPADLELTVDKLPVVEAWRHVPNAEQVYVAPGTPESGDIRTPYGEQVPHESALARLLVESKEGFSAANIWCKKQGRELRSLGHEIVERSNRISHTMTERSQHLRTWIAETCRRWTPPREYHAPVHLDPVSTDSKVTRIDSAVDLARKQFEAMRARHEAEQKLLQEQARLAEESRRRAREAAEARALLEKQRKIEAMVAATELLRERVVTHHTPEPQPEPQKPRPLARRRPRFLPRTRRERAFFRAGIASLCFALTMAALAAEALHPRPASSAIPQQASAPAATAPAPQVLPAPVTTATTAPAATPASVPAEVVAPEKPSAATQVLSRAVLTHSARPSHIQRSTAPEDSSIAEDEVIVRKPLTTTRASAAKPKPGIVHFSDLN
ncbi:MAG TPA: hypothetical protein VGL89_00810 [Candidatus Koribacter sp.]|jgi:hypothetical protein